MADKPITLASNDFELFGVPVRFAQDLDALGARWKELQREAHPDKFATHSAAAQRLAMQWSVRINEAYRRLQDPLKRATYLCELFGAPVDAENNTAMPAEFLMQQMQWRDALEGATSAAQVEELDTEVRACRLSALKHCAELLDLQHDAKQAVAQVRSLMFIERFRADIEDRLATIETSGGAPAGPVRMA